MICVVCGKETNIVYSGDICPECGGNDIKKNIVSMMDWLLFGSPVFHVFEKENECRSCGFKW